MNINWAIADGIVLDPTIDISHLKNIGSFWGGWKTYRTCSTDNTICYDKDRARELIKNRFNEMSNFYVHASLFTEQKLPPRIWTFGGDFEHEVENRDEIISIHLCSGISDIVLLYGFDWSTISLDRLSPHYRGLTYEVIKSNPNIQYVLVDHDKKLDAKYKDLDNLTQDTLKNVLAIAI